MHRCSARLCHHHDGCTAEKRDHELQNSVRWCKLRISFISGVTLFVLSPVVVFKIALAAACSVASIYVRSHMLMRQGPPGCISAFLPQRFYHNDCCLAHNRFPLYAYGTGKADMTLCSAGSCLKILGTCCLKQIEELGLLADLDDQVN